jgi:hypothetical protein
VRPQRIEIHVDELVLHGFGPVDEARLAETVAGRLEESLRRSPDGIRTADAQLFETDQLTVSEPLADLIATSLDGAVRS